eukprot:CAMPEP_0114322380 /NCGR_PEP_ID=MMETSP0059-20121206/27196_1 /TAXON_ID=36894 /ORGANISM="Pyramimonas parkeae, Strain CCMP726" /LENGTH=107 /DNA_ID=CAMNT_0001450355 /DNA_START=168 /DNA_END=491 /DNA_ORIENTATION=-
MSICARFTLYLLVTEATHWPSSWELVMRCCVVSAGRLRISTPGWHVNSPTELMGWPSGQLRVEVAVSSQGERWGQEECGEGASRHDASAPSALVSTRTADPESLLFG